MPGTRPSRVRGAVSGLLVREFTRNDKPRVTVSGGQREKTFSRVRRGLATLGSQKPETYLTEHADGLRHSGVSDAALAMLVATAENEGNLDAINSCDNAFLSFGMFQWTAGTGGGRGELGALLERVRTEAPGAFATYFSGQGIAVSGSSGIEGWLTEALARTVLGDPGTWTTAEERRLLDAYVAIRRTYGSPRMTDSEKRAAVIRGYLDAGRLSGERGSFKA